MTRILLLRANLPHPHQSLGIPLGLLYLVSALRHRARTPFEVQVLDPGLARTDVTDIGDIISDYGPDIVGISALTPEMPGVHAMAAESKTRLPAARVVVGGPCTNADQAEVLSDPNIDVAVFGEAEETFPELVDCLAAGDDISKVNGIAFRESEGIHVTPPRIQLKDLDAIPHPAWDAIDMHAYSAVRNMNGGLLAARPYMALFTSRGCPYRCNYCHEVFGKTTRYRSPENVVDEMEHLHRNLGVQEFHIYDDIFNLDRRRAGRICELMIERGLQVKMAFPNALRGDILTHDLVDKLRRAGTYTTCLAIESASPRIQKLIKKNLKIDKLREMIGVCADAGILTIGYFMLGFPTETMEEIQMTVDFAVESKLHRACFFAVVPFPGSDLEGLVRQHYPEYRYDEQFGYFSTDSFYGWATGVNMGEIQRRAYRNFYLDPNRLWRLFKAYPSTASFLAEGKAAAFTMIGAFHKLREKPYFKAQGSSVPVVLRRGI